MIVYCVNDGAVMKAWEKDQFKEAGIKEDEEDGTGFFKFFADTRGEFSKALDMVMDHPGPLAAIGSPRCKRFAMLVKDGTVLAINVSEGPDDPDEVAFAQEALAKFAARSAAELQSEQAAAATFTFPSEVNAANRHPHVGEGRQPSLREAARAILRATRWPQRRSFGSSQSGVVLTASKNACAARSPFAL